MVRYGPHIQVDGSELQDPREIQNYNLSVINQLMTVADVGGGQDGYRTGRWIMLELDRQLTIKPSLQQRRDAQGRPMLDVQQHPILIPNLDNSTEGDIPDREFEVSTGVPGLGTDVTIRYSPEAWWYIDARRIGFDATTHRFVRIPGGGAQRIGDGNAIEPDDILLHEMVHAVRQMKGLWLAPARFPLDNDYPSLEEFFAVMVANIYVSERDNSYDHRPLRGRYTNRQDGADPLFHELDQDLQDSRAFYNRYHEAINRLCSPPGMFQLVNRLALVKARFNPIRVWQEEQERRRQQNPPSLMDDFLLNRP